MVVIIYENAHFVLISSWCFQHLDILLDHTLDTLDVAIISGQPDLSGTRVANHDALIKSSTLCNMHLPATCIVMQHQLFNTLLPTKLSLRIVIPSPYGMLLAAACRNPCNIFLADHFEWRIHLQCFVVITEICAWTFDEGVAVLLPVLLVLCVTLWCGFNSDRWCVLHVLVEPMCVN